MNIRRLFPALAVSAAVGLSLSLPASAEDIDIFLTPASGGSGKPAVLFVLDNTSNWSRASQQWPDYPQQGKSEAAAIKQAIQSLDENFSVGLMEFGTEASATKNGGFVAFDISTMDVTNKPQLTTILDRVFANITDPHEKLSSGREYGDLLLDVNNYFAGLNSVFGNQNVFAAHADSDGYTTDYTLYESPLLDENECGDVVIVFVSNPDSSGPTGDTATNTAALAALGANTTQIQFPGFTTTTNTTTTNLVSTTSTQCIKDTDLAAGADGCLVNGYTSVSAARAACPPPNGTSTDSLYTSCQCTALAKCGPGNKGHYYKVDGLVTTTTVTPTGEFVPPPKGTGNTYPNADEWSRYFFQKGILIGGTRRFVRTYTIDVYNAQQNADHTALMQSMARVGGGKYYAAKSQQMILDAVLDIFSDIQSVNSTFASAALPISAANRSQSENQVYMGLFRPDPKANPRWFGNLKQYQLIKNPDGSIKLGDGRTPPKAAVDPGSGFLSECSSSIWSFDTGAYFENVAINPSPQSLCIGTPNNVFSDAPDGPRVEKGGVAEILRTGNNPPATSSAPDYLLRRNVKTVAAGVLADFTVATTGLAGNTVNFTRGLDTQGEYVPQTVDTPLVEVRPSVHGDVIHSRPLPIDYGSTTGTVVYYGANDGHFRAIKGKTGQELWSFVAPEFFTRLDRLRANEPPVKFPTPTTSDSELEPTPKDYFFDGSPAVYQAIGNSPIYIYAAMRRGGRMIYAFNVTTWNSPSLLFKVGCPNFGNDTGCTSGMAEIGQTWATPAVGLVKGFSSGTIPVVLVAGGFDPCEDEDVKTPACGSAKGRVVYALRGDTGALLATFNPPTGVTMRSTVADIAMVDGNVDGFVDHAYVADMGGSIFRIDLSTPLTFDARAPADWTMTRVAHTTGAYRKFEFAPTLVQAGSTVYVAVGSGDREHPLITHYPYGTVGDTSDAAVVNRAYVFIDTFGVDSDLDLDSSTLMNDVTADAPGESCDAEAVLPSGDRRGWFLDLTENGRGEQVVTSPVVAGGLLAFSTNRPTPDPDLVCGANLGEARGYLMNVLTGAGTIGVDGDCGGDRSVEFLGGGLPPTPVITRVNIGGTIRTVAIGVADKEGNKGSSIDTVRIKPKIKSTRQPKWWFQPDTTD